MKKIIFALLGLLIICDVMGAYRITDNSNTCMERDDAEHYYIVNHITGSVRWPAGVDIKVGDVWVSWARNSGPSNQTTAGYYDKFCFTKDDICNTPAIKSKLTNQVISQGWSDRATGYTATVTDEWCSSTTSGGVQRETQSGGVECPADVKTIGKGRDNSDADKQKCETCVKKMSGIIWIGAARNADIARQTKADANANKVWMWRDAARSELDKAPYNTDGRCYNLKWGDVMYAWCAVNGRTYTSGDTCTDGIGPGGSGIGGGDGIIGGVVPGSIEDIKRRWAVLTDHKGKWADSWKKEKDGTFNTNKLLIDAAGGTVVGAGAGILTNVLMKNAQLKSGYENIQCVSGSGATAVYGESFIVR